MRYYAWLFVVGLGLASCAKATNAGDGGPGGGSDGSAAADMTMFIVPKQDAGVKDMTHSPVDLSSIDFAHGGIQTADLGNGGPVLPAEDCSANIPMLVPGVSYPNQDTTPLVDSFTENTTIFGVFSVNSAQCQGNFVIYPYDGRDGVYQILVPAKKTLTVTLDIDPSTPWDAALVLSTSCTAAGLDCLGSSDNDGTSGSEVATWYNMDSANAATVLILVDSYASSDYGKYTIRADLN